MVDENDRDKDGDIPSTGEILDGETNTCGECGQNFHSRSELIAHYQSTHQR
jgi:hypothetical protein